MKKILTLAITCCVMMLAKPSSAAIHGTLGACVGATSTLFDSSSSGVMGPGTWSSSNVAIATVGASTGVVTGVSVGTAIITFVGTTGTSTAIFTVSPTPSAITGGSTPFCASTTVTLSSTTPGGAWSSSSSVASVSPAGVVIGSGSGTATIYYTVGTGCSTSTIVTVIGTPAVDSLTGPSSVCIGGTATYVCTTSGGTWSTSSAGIGTISATGVLTGVSGGTVIVSYSVSGTCGTGVRTRAVTVSGSTVTGTITGTTSVATGFTTSLSNSVSGGTWSSSNPAVATISASGVVTGVAVGTSVISYAVTGCSGLAYATTIVTVTAANCISGNVLFSSGAAYYGPVRVWLIKYNPSTLMLTAIDSTVVYASGTSVGYSFCGMGTDSFRVKAACDSSSTPTTMGYLPTYHTSSAFWNTATVINHVSGTHDINKNITMAYGTGTTGPGFIGGSVTAGANKGTAEGDPVVNQLVYCINDATGAILQQTYTNSLGQYSFSNLPTGATYKVYPELMSFTTTPYPTISLTSSSSSVTAASFRKNTLPKTITPITSGVAEVNANNAGISVYPNPAKGAVNVSWNVAITGTATITVSDVTGRIVLSTTADMTSANGTTKVDVSTLNAGMYLISVKNNGVNYNTKVSIQ